MGDRVPEHGCRGGRQNEVETKKKKKGEERGIDATLQQRIARALAGFTRWLCLQIVSRGSQECSNQLRIDDDVDVDEHHMHLQVFWEVLHRLLEELLLCPFFSVILLHLPDLDQPTTVVGRDYSAAAVLLQEVDF
ncbi:unnamed protein product [Sphagnum troendelagicum]|uniref:Uncharacterized protein n=1 Tax=Sphagnum troendelagicum TaxID=128251 RepID=A0ABP0TIM5_9BRYO